MHLETPEDLSQWHQVDNFFAASSIFDLGGKTKLLMTPPIEGQREAQLAVSDGARH